MTQSYVYSMHTRTEHVWFGAIIFGCRFDTTNTRRGRKIIQFDCCCSLWSLNWYEFDKNEVSTEQTILFLIQRHAQVTTRQHVVRAKKISTTFNQSFHVCVHHSSHHILSTSASERLNIFKPQMQTRCRFASSGRYLVSVVCRGRRMSRYHIFTFNCVIVIACSCSRSHF